MTIAVIKDGICIDVCLFEDLTIAKNFLAIGVWPGATAVLELPDGHGVGSSYDGEKWTKPEPETPNTEQTLTERLAAAETKNKQLSAQLTAAGNQIEMLEGCVIELAQTVYA